VRGTSVLVAVLVGIGCHYDAGALGPSEGSTATTAATPEDTSSSTRVSLTSGMTTATTFDDAATSDASTDELGTTGPDVPMLVDLGLLSRWYLDEASEGQDPVAALDHHAPAVDLELRYSDASPSYAVLDGNRGLQWLSQDRGGRAVVPIFGTKLETELTMATEVTFELVVAVTAVSDMYSRYLHIGSIMLPADLSIGSSRLDEVEVHWGGIFRRYAANLDGGRQVIHVVIDTTQDDPIQRLRAYLDGVELVHITDQAPAQGEGLLLLPTSDLVLGNRTDGGRTFQGSLQYAAIYTAVLDEAQLENNAAVLMTNDDTP